MEAIHWLLIFLVVVTFRVTLTLLVFWPLGALDNALILANFGYCAYLWLFSKDFRPKGKNFRHFLAKTTIFLIFPLTQPQRLWNFTLENGAIGYICAPIKILQC